MRLHVEAAQKVLTAFDLMALVYARQDHGAHVRFGPCDPSLCLSIHDSIARFRQWLARGSRRDRVAAKFVENEFEKVDRLMELYGRYGARVTAEERRLGTSDESYDDEEVLLARMDAGLYTLQQVGSRTCA